MLDHSRQVFNTMSLHPSLLHPFLCLFLSIPPLSLSLYLFHSLSLSLLSCCSLIKTLVETFLCFYCSIPNIKLPSYFLWYYFNISKASTGTIKLRLKDTEQSSPSQHTWVRTINLGTCGLLVRAVPVRQAVTNYLMYNCLDNPVIEALHPKMDTQHTHKLNQQWKKRLGNQSRPSEEP